MLIIATISLTEGGIPMSIPNGENISREQRAQYTWGRSPAHSIYSGSWSNAYEARSEGAYTVISEQYDYAEAINTAYMRLEDPVLIKRQMLYLKPGIWILADSFRGKGEHTYSRYFNFPDQKVAIQNNGLSTLHTSDNLRIQPLEDIEIQLSDAWWSPEYNLKNL